MACLALPSSLEWSHSAWTAATVLPWPLDTCGGLSPAEQPRAAHPVEDPLGGKRPEEVVGELAGRDLVRVQLTVYPVLEVEINIGCKGAQGIARVGLQPGSLLT